MASYVYAVPEVQSLPSHPPQLCIDLLHIKVRPTPPGFHLQALDPPDPGPDICIITEPEE